MRKRKATVNRLDENMNFQSTGNNWYGLNAGWRDRFSAMWSGCGYMPRTGRYTFCTVADDGSMLYIGGERLVNNDGLHGMRRRSAAVNANQGYVPIAGTFFENGGGAGMIAEWSGPGIKGRRVISYDALTTQKGD